MLKQRVPPWSCLAKATRCVELGFGQLVSEWPLIQEDKWPMLVASVRRFKKQSSLVPVCISTELSDSYFREWILVTVMYRPLLCEVVVFVLYTCECCVHPRDSICAPLAVGSARFAPSKLLSMRKKPGISPVSFDLKFHQQKQHMSPLISVNDLQKLDWKSQELSAVISWQHTDGQRSCKRYVCPWVLLCWRAPPKWWINLGAAHSQRQDKASPGNCLKCNFWCFGQAERLCCCLCFFKWSGQLRGASLGCTKCKAKEPDPTCLGFYGWLDALLKKRTSTMNPGWSAQLAWCLISCTD